MLAVSVARTAHDVRTHDQALLPGCCWYIIIKSPSKGYRAARVQPNTQFNNKVYVSIQCDKTATYLCDFSL